MLQAETSWYSSGLQGGYNVTEWDGSGANHSADKERRGPL